ncbi:MAG: hypothetical protein ABI459_03810, partial [Deltaproteobacteria bacterium]
MAEENSPFWILKKPNQEKTINTPAFVFTNFPFDHSQPQPLDSLFHSLLALHMSDQVEPYEYVLYIDEAGDDGLKKVMPVDNPGATEWLVIGAVLI